MLRNVRLAAFIPLATLLACSTGASSPSFSSSDEALKKSAAPPSPPSPSSSASSLGTSANFAILARTAVTCTDTTIIGNVGVFPGSAITQTNCPVTGTINAANAAAAQGQTDFLAAYEAFRALPCDRTLTTLDGQTLVPGVYCFDAAATSAGGVLTLDGPATGLWVFKVGTLGTGALTGTGFSVVTRAGTPPACNSVFWWVAEAVTLTDSKFVGTVLAGAAVTLTRGTFNGNALSKAAVTITGDAVTGCPGAGAPACVDDDDDDGHDDHGKKDGGKDKMEHHKRHAADGGECREDDDHHDDNDHHDDKNKRGGR
ncbi:MAG: ice-binding family protein [Myxococcales bacterium]